MTRRSRYAHPEEFRAMNLTEVARELDVPTTRARTILRSFAPYLKTFPRVRQGKEILYPAPAVEVIKAVLKRPHRTIPGASDWLTPYEGDRHG